MQALLLIILAVLVIGGSGLVYYVAAGHPSALRAQATAVAQSFLTAQAPASIYTQTTRGKPFINDPLNSASGSSWSESSQAGSSCTFTGGAYHIMLQGQNAIVACFSKEGGLRNFTFQAQMTIIQGVDGGLLFRVNSTQGSSYLFVVGANGWYQLALLGATNNSTILNTAPSAAIKTGLNSSNLLTVIARDSSIYLYINQQYVTTVIDSTLSSGGIGFFGAKGPDPSGDVAFSNAQVWIL